MNPKRSNIANLPRLEAFMDEAGLDALVLRSGQNFTYLSVITNKTAAGLAERDGWIQTVVLYEAYVDSPYAKLAEVLHDAGLASTRIGFEKDYISAEHWDAIAKAAPKVQMTDCTRLMDRVRWIKTEAQIALLRRAADLQDDAYLEVFRRIRPRRPGSRARRAARLPACRLAHS